MALLQRSSKCGHDEVFRPDHLNDFLVRDDAHGLEDDGNWDVLKKRPCLQANIQNHRVVIDQIENPFS